MYVCVYLSFSLGASVSVTARLSLWLRLHICLYVGLSVSPSVSPGLNHVSLSLFVFVSLRLFLLSLSGLAVGLLIFLSVR